MMKKRIVSLLLCLLTVLSLTACGGSSSYSSAPMASYNEMKESAAVTEDAMDIMDGGYGYYEDYSDEVAAEEEALPEPAGAPESPDVSSLDAANVKLVYRAYLETEALDFDAAVSALERQVSQLGGYIESSDMNRYASTRRTADYTVRIPSKNYRAFVDAWGLDENCSLLSKTESVEDIGAQYFDAETRLATLKNKMDRLQMLMSEATEMEDIISLEYAISDTEYEIERYSSTLNRYNSLVNFSTVQIYLREVVVLTEPEKESFLERLGQELRYGAEDFVEFLEDLAYWLAYNILDLLFLAAVIAVVVAVVRKVRKNRKKRTGRKEWKLPFGKRKQQTAEKGENPTETKPEDQE